MSSDRECFKLLAVSTSIASVVAVMCGAVKSGEGDFFGGVAVLVASLIAASTVENWQDRRRLELRAKAAERAVRQSLRLCQQLSRAIRMHTQQNGLRPYFAPGNEYRVERRREDINELEEMARKVRDDAATWVRLYLNEADLLEELLFRHGQILWRLRECLSHIDEFGEVPATKRALTERWERELQAEEKPVTELEVRLVERMRPYLLLADKRNEALPH
jgi:hypothetical protein